MTKSVAVGIMKEDQVNYITFRFRDISEIDFFCEDLAEYILNKYIKFFIKYIINKNYGYFNHKDKYAVFEFAQKAFLNARSKKREIHRESIQKKLYKYFIEENADIIILEGFICFRILNCFRELEKLIDSTVEEYLTSKEYESFMDLLKQFVDAQKPMLQSIHIKTEGSGQYLLYDENFETITKSYILDLEYENSETYKEVYINEDDFLLSALISLAPKKIIFHNIHNIKNNQLYNTIQKIFPKRISICNGCSLCVKK